MRAAFLAQDRWEFKFATKEGARHMSSPTVFGMESLKRIGRFLKHMPRVVQRLERQPPPKELVVFTDTNHAGCPVTRKTTSCSAVFFGSHCVQFSCTTQVPISLSTGESEWHGVVKGACVGLDMRSLAFGLTHKTLPLVLRPDSIAAIGIGSKRGAGKLRHIDTSSFWLQQHITAKTVLLDKVAGEVNPADLGTKHLASPRMVALMKQLGLHHVGGQHKLALEAGR